MAGPMTGSAGDVTADDQKTGRQMWRFYTVPGSPRRNRATDGARWAATWSWGILEDGVRAAPPGTGDLRSELNRVISGPAIRAPMTPMGAATAMATIYLTAIVAGGCRPRPKSLATLPDEPARGLGTIRPPQTHHCDLADGGKPSKVMMQAPTNGSSM